MGIRRLTDKPKIEFTEHSIQQALHSFFNPNSVKYEMNNLYVFNWESDVLLETRSGYIHEFEIKISRTDFKNDFKKEDKHNALDAKFAQTKVEKEYWGKWNFHRIPNYFYYAVPYGMIQVDDVPRYAGLVYINEIGGIVTVKKAPRLHDYKYKDEELNLGEKFYYNMVNWKNTARNWQRDYNNAVKHLNEELESKHQELPYSEMKRRMNVAETQARLWEENNKRLIQDANYNNIERRLFIMEIRKFNPMFDVKTIEEQAIKKYDEIYKR